MAGKGQHGPRLSRTAPEGNLQFTGGTRPGQNGPPRRNLHRTPRQSRVTWKTIQIWFGYMQI